MIEPILIPVRATRTIEVSKSSKNSRSGVSETDSLTLGQSNDAYSQYIANMDAADEARKSHAVPLRQLERHVSFLTRLVRFCGIHKDQDKNLRFRFGFPIFNVLLFFVSLAIFFYDRVVPGYKMGLGGAIANEAGIMIGGALVGTYSLYHRTVVRRFYRSAVWSELVVTLLKYQSGVVLKQRFKISIIIAMVLLPVVLVCLPLMSLSSVVYLRKPTAIVVIDLILMIMLMVSSSVVIICMMLEVMFAFAIVAEVDQSFATIKPAFEKEEYNDVLFLKLRREFEARLSITLVASDTLRPIFEYMELTGPVWMIVVQRAVTAIARAPVSPWTENPVSFVLTEGVAIAIGLVVCVACVLFPVFIGHLINTAYRRLHRGLSRLPVRSKLALNAHTALLRLTQSMQLEFSVAPGLLGPVLDSRAIVRIALLYTVGVLLAVTNGY